MFKKALTRRFSTLLIAESRNGVLNPANLNALAAAQQIGQPVDVICLTTPNADSASLNQFPNTNTVFTCQDEVFTNPVADSFATTVGNFIEAQGNYTHVIAPSTTWAKDYVPRIAARFNSQAVTDVTEVLSESEFVRPVYAGNAMATVKAGWDGVKFITARPTNFEASEETGQSANTEEVSLDSIWGDYGDRSARFVSEELTESDRPDLGEAKIVVSGGRGEIFIKKIRFEEWREFLFVGELGGCFGQHCDRSFESSCGCWLLSE
jgi:electron transfer flavoprotein alpha subunit